MATGTDTLAGTRGGARPRGASPASGAALDRAAALSPQLAASCTGAPGESWLRPGERVAGPGTEAEGPLDSPSGEASWSNFSQPRLCLGEGHLRRMRVFPAVSEGALPGGGRGGGVGTGSGRRSRVGGASLQPRTGCCGASSDLWGCPVDIPGGGHPRGRTRVGMRSGDRVGPESKLRRTSMCPRVSAFQTSEPRVCHLYCLNP